MDSIGLIGVVMAMMPLAAPAAAGEAREVAVQASSARVPELADSSAAPLPPSAFAVASGDRSSPCARISAAIAAGSLVARAALAPAACEGRAAPAFRYDRRYGAVRALRDLAPGDLVAMPAAALIADVLPGETLYLTSRAGAVAVERAVVAAQPGRFGKALFVRTADGELASARLEAAR